MAAGARSIPWGDPPNWPRKGINRWGGTNASWFARHGKVRAAPAKKGPSEASGGISKPSRDWPIAIDLRSSVSGGLGINNLKNVEIRRKLQYLRLFNFLTGCS
jgi:hypothetical protein